MEIILDVDRNYYQNLSELYEEVKRQRGALALQEQTKEKKKEVKEPEKEAGWFSRFRWGFTDSGFLFVGGKDSKQNEEIIKMMEDKDLLFHADYWGGSMVLLKNGIEAGERDRAEAGDIAASFCKAWKDGVPFVDVFYITKRQIGKEGMKAGQIQIFGKREWLRKVKLGYKIVCKEGWGCLAGKESSRKGAVVIQGESTAQKIKEKIQERLGCFVQAKQLPEKGRVVFEF
ncbi:MAG: NFACT RNA binding domain-containing protein [Candidatus Anstonellales archaeon]